MDGDVLTLRVLLQNDEYVKTLEQGLTIANERVELLETRYRQLESNYARISHYNIELIDLLKSHGIRYRPHLDNGRGKWEKSK